MSTMISANNIVINGGKFNQNYSNSCLQEGVDEFDEGQEKPTGKEENVTQGVEAGSRQPALGKQASEWGIMKFMRRVFNLGDKDKLICIAVIGNIESKKAQMINCLKQGHPWKVLGNASVDISPIKIDFPELGRSVIVIDTPEKDEDLGWDAILSMVNYWLANQRRRKTFAGIKLSGILYLHSIIVPDKPICVLPRRNSGRDDIVFIINEDSKVIRPEAPPLRIIKNAFGKRVGKNVLVVTTGWDTKVERWKREGMEERFQMWQTECHGRVERFDNKPETAWGVIERLIKGD